MCPFKVDVHSPVFPEKVGVTGPNLKTGVIGKDLDWKIDPRAAGHGKFSYCYYFKAELNRIISILNHTSAYQ